MTEVTDESRREVDSEATISAPPTGITVLAGFHRDSYFCLNIALRRLKDLYSWKPPSLFLPWSPSDHAPIHSFVMRRTHMPWEFILCRGLSYLLHSSYLLLNTTARVHWLRLLHRWGNCRKERWANVSPGMTSRAGHGLSNSRARAPDDSWILPPWDRKAWNLHDKLSHLNCESRLKTGLGLASRKAGTMEEWNLADGWSRQSSSCAGNMSYVAPAALRKEKREEEWEAEKREPHFWKRKNQVV